MERGLFHQVIYHSGSALMPVFLSNEPVQYAKDIGDKMGCHIEDINRLNECLVQLVNWKILAAYKGISKSNNLIMFLDLIALRTHLLREGFAIIFIIWEKNVKKILVRLYWSGWQWHFTPVRYPTTAYHGDSWLLVFTPGPVHPSLANLNTTDSSMAPILMASLVRTFRQHELAHCTGLPTSNLSKT